MPAFVMPSKDCRQATSRGLSRASPPGSIPSPAHHRSFDGIRKDGFAANRKRLPKRSHALPFWAGPTSRSTCWRKGSDPSAGASTGMDALHWAANRGRLEIVRLLLRQKEPLETRSMYGATVLGTAVWSAIHEPRPGQLPIIEELLNAGARVNEVEYPTGNEQVDALLQHFGTSAS